jgi:hypothetical protein
VTVGPASGDQGQAEGSSPGVHAVDLDDGSTAEGAAILLAVGRAFPLDELGLEHYGLDVSGRTPSFPRDGRLKVADGLWVIGDPAGPELHTHQAHYQGEVAVRMALGEWVKPDYRALPRSTYTDPEASSVGSVDEALAAGAFRSDDAVRGGEAIPSGRFGHVDRRRPGEPRAHRRRWPVRRIDAIYGACWRSRPASRSASSRTVQAFPSTSRVFSDLFADAAGSPPA